MINFNFTFTFTIVENELSLDIRVNNIEKERESKLYTSKLTHNMEIQKAIHKDHKALLDPPNPKE